VAAEGKDLKGRATRRLSRFVGIERAGILQVGDPIAILICRTEVCISLPGTRIPPVPELISIIVGITEIPHSIPILISLSWVGLSWAVVQEISQAIVILVAQLRLNIGLREAPILTGREIRGEELIGKAELIQALSLVSL